MTQLYHQRLCSFLRSILALVACVALTSFVALAQQDFAQIEGTVRDPNGAAVPNATVTIRAEALNLERTATASEEGVYIIPQLRPGSYTVSITGQGFSTTQIPDVVLGVGQNRTLDVALTAGAVTEEVTVTAGGDAATIDQGSNRLGANVTEREVEELPVNGRNVSQLYLLSPGAQNSGTGNFNELRFNARANQQNQSKLDGIESTAIFDASPGYLTVQGSQFRLQTSLENIQEFRVDSSNYPAEYGTGTGGQINVIGKAGTNEFHGSLFHYLRNDALDARNFFDGAEPSKLRLNQFGGSIGGPIVPDRMFFFGSYEGLRQRAGFNVIELTPSEFVRDFINFYGTTDPRGDTARAALGISATNATAAQARLNSLRATGIINAFPVGNGDLSTTGGGLTNTVRFLQTNSVAALNEDAFSFRFDGRLTEDGRFSFFTRYQRDTGDLSSPDGTTGRFLVATQKPDNFVFSLQQLYGGSIVNETKLGFNRAPTTISTSVPNIGGINGIDLSASTINLTGSVVNPGVNGGAATGIATPGGLTRQSSAGNGRAQPINAESFSLIDNMAVIKGNHSLKFGGEIRRIFVRFDQLGGTTFSFPSVGDFLLNQNLATTFIGDLSAPGDIRIATNPVTTISRQREGLHRGEQHYLIGYGQDEWRIRPNLTINYGLRYEYYSPNRERDNRVIILDAATLRLRPNDQDFYAATKNNFGPRLALTFAPARFNNKTVFRLGGGLYYGPGQYEDVIQPIESDVFRTQSTFTGGLTTGISALVANQTGAPQAFQARAYDVEGYRVPERVAQYGASVQQELPGNTVLTVAYVGSLGRNLFQRGIVNRILPGQTTITGGSSTPLPAGVGIINRIDPATGRVVAVTTVREATLLNSSFNTTTSQIQATPGSVVQPFTEIDYKTSGGRDNYNALQATVNRRFTGGLTLGGQYQWGHSIGTTQGSNEATTTQNPYSFAEERGNNTVDIRHSANFSALYELPFGEGRRFNLGGAANSIFGGFQIGGIFNGRSGLPINVQISRADVVIRCAQAGGCPSQINTATGAPVAGAALIPQGTIGRLPTVNAASPLPTGFIAVVNTPGGNASRNTRRPDYVAGADPYLRNESGDLRYINPAAFAIPQAGAYGNLSRNAVYGPTFHQFDLTLQKRFRITETANIEFRSEIYNLFNKANFTNPPVLLTEQLPSITANASATTGVTTVTGFTSGLQPGQPFAAANVPIFGVLNSTVGRTVGLGTNRQIQFALRLNF